MSNAGSPSMRLSLPTLRGRKPPFPTVKLKPVAALPDALSTTLNALKESTDVFPPLKSAVGAAIAVWDIAMRVKHSKADARAIALRTEEVIGVMAAAVADANGLPPAMLLSIERFTLLLDEIRGTMEGLAHSGRVSRAIHLNRNERTVRDIKTRLEDAYRDFLVASALRVETQQTHIDTNIKTLQRQLELQRQESLFYSRLSIFLAAPW
ncbi:hypothetical protein C8R47DRAFT_84225 [Mycena vitilis]|nr:hypothetical protein C8R47DRAFT_84225 [Mycena vitilis]